MTYPVTIEEVAQRISHAYEVGMIVKLPTDLIGVLAMVSEEEFIEALTHVARKAKIYVPPLDQIPIYEG